MHKFAEKLAEGEKFERQLDAVFEQEYTIVPVSRADQRRGIDRFFSDKDGNTYAVDYKSDSVAARTGNAFIETVSVDATKKPGWAKASQADWIIYFVPPQNVAHCFLMSVIREQLASWEATYPTRAAWNDGYRTWGVCVPMKEFARFAEWTISTPG